MGLVCCKTTGILEDSDDDALDSSIDNVRDAPIVRGNEAEWVYVVRHGEREDEINPEWIELSDRRYDPPLTSQGRIDARRVASELVKLPSEQQPNAVVTSPFLRCLQTAATIYDELQKSSPDDVECARRIIVDFDLSEVHNPQFMKCDDAPVFTHAKVVKQLRLIVGDDVKVSFTGTQPEYPEPLKKARKRYDSALLTSPLPRQNTVLVSHGEAVARAVTTLNPNALVFETKYCSYISRSRQSPYHPWHLVTKSGETGCSWSEEEIEDA
ncbi:hypothetical protein DIPPA_25635 [Diplonema papillatum]|nr:hypothetical protein DIPPA_25635 [Diplonema papillatum]|eukprot:gene13009-20065_t